MIILILIILLTCCKTQAVVNEIVDPQLDFPKFPSPFDKDGNAIPNFIDGNIIIPLWYWILIAEYVVDNDKAREQYEGWKSVYVEK